MVQLSGAGSSDPDQSAATLDYLWDLDGDGTFGETGLDATRGDEVGSAPSFSAAGLDGPDTVVVRLRVVDAELLSDEDEAEIQIINLAPQLTNVAVTPEIDEHGAVTLSGGIVDPGTLDTFVLDVDWGDPLSPNNVEQYSFAAGTSSFTLTHQYLDDNPSLTAADQYSMTLSLRDDDPVAAPLPELLSWWPGEGNALDIADGNDGTLQGDATFSSGQIGQAFSFDGVGDRVVGTLDGFAGGNTPLTIASWFNQSVVAGHPGKGTIGVGATGNREHFFLRLAARTSSDGGIWDGTIDNQNRLWIGVDDGGLDRWWGSSTVVHSGQWYHAAATFDPATNEARLYLNGVLERTIVLSAGLNLTNAFYLGGDAYNDNFFNGRVDEAQVFTRALTAAEVQSLATGQGASVETVTTRVRNVAPQFANLSVTSLIDENGVVTLTGEIVDPGALDTFRLDVDWGDGAGDNVTFAAGTTSFTLTHQYLDDDPSGTSQDAYAIILSLSDDDSSGIPTADLLSWWPGEGSAVDIADGNDGNLQGDVTFATGSVGQAFSFDGAGDRVVGTLEGFAAGNTPITITAWFNEQALYDHPGKGILGVGATGERQHFFLRLAGHAPPSCLSCVGAGDGQNRLFIGADDGGLDRWWGSTSIVDTGEWYHAAATFDPTTNEVKLYLNGALERTVLLSTGLNLTNHFYIGGDAYDDNFFHGQVDEPQVFTRALTATEIQSLASQAPAQVTTATLDTTVRNVAPSFEAGDDEALLAPVAGAFGRNGLTFTDPGADQWSGTVNFGEPGGLDVPLVINQVTKSFDLSHTYGTEGTFTVTVIVNDDDLGSHTDTFQVTVNLNDPPPPPSGRSIIVLNASISGALDISGNGVIDIPGSVLVNSSHSKALSASGNAHITADSIRVVGGVDVKGNATLDPDPVTGVEPAADPLATLSPPPNDVARGSVNCSGNGSQTLLPGVYSYIKASGNCQLMFNSGTYIIAGGEFKLTGNAAISGSEVFIYHAGSNFPEPGGSVKDIQLSGNATSTLTPPDSGPYRGLLIFQARDNSERMTLSGNQLGLTGTIYAPAAQLQMSGNSQVQLTLIVDRLRISGNASSTLLAVNQGDNDADVPVSALGQLLSSVVEVSLRDATGAIGAEHRARLADAIVVLNAALVGWGITLTEVSESQYEFADVRISVAAESPCGSAADGVLGCTTSDGDVTLLTEWSWFGGTDPTQITAGQFDFQTILTHELGHAIGLDHSSDAASVMHETLSAGQARRELGSADLLVLHDDHASESGGGEALYAEPVSPEALPTQDGLQRQAADSGQRLRSQAVDAVFAQLAARSLPRSAHNNPAIASEGYGHGATAAPLQAHPALGPPHEPIGAASSDASRAPAPAGVPDDDGLDLILGRQAHLIIELNGDGLLGEV